MNRLGIIIFLTVFVVGALSTGGIPSADAALKLEISDGSSTITVVDGGALDANSSVGSVTFSGSLSSNFSVVVVNVVSKPVIGPGRLSFSGLVVGGGATITVKATDTDYTDPNPHPELQFGIGGTSNGPLNSSSFIGLSNMEFEMTTAGPSFGPFTGAFDGSGSASIPDMGTPYSLTIQISVTHNSSTSTSWGSVLTALAGPPQPAIDIEKATNGFDADSPTGPVVTVGDDVTLTYVVTNTGNVPLANVVVTDDNGTASTADDFEPTFVGGDTNNDGLLDVTETWTYTHTVTAVAGQFSCDSSVTGDSPGGTTVSDTDPSNHFGELPDIENCCENNKNKPKVLTMQYTGQDCTGITGESKTHSQDEDKVDCSGDPVSTNPVFIVASDKEDLNNSKTRVWFTGTVSLNGTYDINATNAGKTKLSANTYVQVFDNAQDLNILQTIKFHTSCSQPLFTGDRFASALLLTCVSENEPIPQIDIEKATNGEDADTPTGPVVVIGSTVTLTYVVTNPGEVSLSNVVVTDDNGTPGTGDDFNPTFVSGDTNNDGKLDTTETWTYTHPMTAAAGQFSCNATVTGDAPGGATVSDTDPSHHFGSPPPEIDIEKATNAADPQNPTPAEDADTPTGPVVAVDSNVTLTYLVKNLSSGPLSDVVVTDDNGTPGNLGDDFSPTPVESGGFNVGDTDGDNLLDVGEVWQYTATTTAQAGQFSCNATVTGKNSSNEMVSDSDPSHHFGSIEDCCADDNKPQVLTMEYTGEDCTGITGASKTHSQNDDKVDCSGDPGSADPVFIVASDKEDLNNSKTRVWFTGTVALNATYLIDAIAADKNRLSANTYVHVFDNAQDRNILQTIKFHTSCSQPLFVGDKFGSGLVVGCLSVPKAPPAISLLQVLQLQVPQVAVPRETRALANFPNPFNPETWIPFELAKATSVNIQIYDMRGQLIRTLELGHLAAGYYVDRAKAAYWDGRNDAGEHVASGLYLYRLTAGDYTAMRRMLILK